MVYVLTSHTVEDYAKWKPIFDKHGDFRKASGSKGGRVFRSVDNPNRLTVLLEWDSADRALEFAKSPQLREAMKSAGVIGQPESSMLEEVESFSK